MTTPLPLKASADLFQKIARAARSVSCVDLERQAQRNLQLIEPPAGSLAIGVLYLGGESTRACAADHFVKQTALADGMHCFLLGEPAQLLMRPFLLGVLVTHLDLLCIVDNGTAAAYDRDTLALVALLRQSLVLVAIAGRTISAQLGAMQPQAVWTSEDATDALTHRMLVQVDPLILRSHAAGTGLLQARSIVTELQLVHASLGDRAALGKLCSQLDAGIEDALAERRRRDAHAKRVQDLHEQRQRLMQLSVEAEEAFSFKLAFWSATRNDVWPRHLGKNLTSELASCDFSQRLSARLRDTAHLAIDAAIAAERERRRAEYASTLPASANARDRFWHRMENQVHESDLKVDFSGESGRVMSQMVVSHAQEIERQLAARVRKDLQGVREKLERETRTLGFDAGTLALDQAFDAGVVALAGLSRDIALQKSAEVMSALGDLKVKWAPGLGEFWASLKWARGFFMFFVQIATVMLVPLVLLFISPKDSAGKRVGSAIVIVMGLSVTFSLFFGSVRARMLRYTRVDEFIAESERCLDIALNAYHRDTVRGLGQEVASVLLKARASVQKQIDARVRDIEMAQRSLAPLPPTRVPEQRAAPATARAGLAELQSVDMDLTRAISEWEGALKKLPALAVLKTAV